ncbi:hypothetical protein [Geotalea toluenoxydans]|uniref:hypothetical protein n=1 Tax=Geotalea toluenoxydans TaxID=421624 RepID=UPI001FB27945|nr:hypothetical protein [Geotalea toluenoxydans]
MLRQKSPLLKRLFVQELRRLFSVNLDEKVDSKQKRDRGERGLKIAQKQLPGAEGDKGNNYQYHKRCERFAHVGIVALSAERSPDL